MNNLEYIKGMLGLFCHDVIVTDKVISFDYRCGGLTGSSLTKTTPATFSKDVRQLAIETDRDIAHAVSTLLADAADDMQLFVKATMTYYDAKQDVMQQRAVWDKILTRLDEEKISWPEWK